MPTLYRIKDERTVYCRAAMKANGGTWNPLTGEWLFRDGGDHANAAVELYRVTRPTVAMRDALQSMVADGTGALAWGFDPNETLLPIDTLDRAHASKLLAAGHAVRRVLGVHPLEDIERPGDEPAAFDTPEFEARRTSRRPRATA